MLRIEGVVRPYAWGSRTAVQQLLGLPATGERIAELWFGGHADDPSPTHSNPRYTGPTLDQAIRAAPDQLLGPAVRSRFGDGLPFLLKILAAEHALSIQVHPTLTQARAGFAAEDAAGVPRDAPNRNYRDPNHKPELIWALTEFFALCGFRPPQRTATLLDRLDVEALR
ncbi:MAG: mannose-6-phosphate isomerase, class I, partial [Actinobacteria bacterium]|nr:mannose-6-phosphate isomerase, class I [Actinomycetota bacterium]